MRQDKHAMAEQEFVQIIELATEHLGAEHPYVMIFSNNYGECLTRMKRYAEAEAMLLRTHAALSKSMGAGNARTSRIRETLCFSSFFRQICSA
jgi:hypothetical protein